MRITLHSFLLLFSIATFGQGDGWNISTTDKSDYTGIAVSNGRIGILTSKKPLAVQHIVLNNVYDMDPVAKVSRVLHGMNYGNLDLYIDNEKITEENISNWSQTLNMKEAAFTTTFTFRNKADISYTIYALRNVQYTGYFDVTIDAKREIDVKVVGKILTPWDYQMPEQSYKVLRDVETSMPILQSVAKSQFGAHQVSTSATFIWEGINASREHQRPELYHEIVSEKENTLSFRKAIKKGESLGFSWTGAQCTTQDFSDPRSESERMVIFNLLTPREELLQGHKELWSKLWKGDIIIEGDLKSQQDVRLALYHLYAFGRVDIEFIKKQVEDFDAFDYYMVGTTPFLSNIKKGLLSKGLNPKQIHIDDFG